MPGFVQPPRVQCEFTGDVRRVGFEIEFAGLELEQVAALVADRLGGEVEKHTEAESQVHVDGLDPFLVELDWQLGKKMARDRLAERRESPSGEAEETVDDPVMNWVTSAAAQIVPVEIVCPPIPMDQLDQLDDVIQALRDKGARGTYASPVYAFGVHINPELPDLDEDTVLAYLKAFSICQGWLVKQHDVDLARRITPYIDLYPNSFVERLLQQSDMKREDLISFYLEHNPTRNRALDMTPLFRHMDEDLLVSLLDDDRINARPTFHYRLPDSTPEVPGWTLADTWRPWCVVEQLACDPGSLVDLAGEWQDWNSNPINLISLDDPPWFETLDRLHADLS